MSPRRPDFETEHLGRTDQAAPIVSWRVKANITLIVLVLGAVLLWHLALVLTTGGMGLGELGRTLRALVHGKPISGLDDPDIVRGGGPVDPPSTAAALAVFALLLLGLFGVLVVASYGYGSWQARRRRGHGFADNTAIRAGLGEQHARDLAAQTRPGLSDTARRRAALPDVALPLGISTGGEPVLLPLEDHALIVAPTGAGKSRDLMIPAALSAPGALVVTCTRPDIVDVIATRRGRRGRVWVFDPLDRLGWPEPMVWDPVAGCRYGEIAISRAQAFTAGLGADDASVTNSGFFRRNAEAALTRLLHAADLPQPLVEDAAGNLLEVPRRTIADVIRWTVNLHNGADEPQRLIVQSHDPLAEQSWPDMLASIATGADETVASSRQTLQQAVEPMALRRVLRWVTPAPDRPTFDPAAFVTGSDTLVLVADQNTATNVSPLCAMLLQAVVDCAKACAARSPGGRLDPPLRIVGDEIANVAPLPKLPELCSDARGFGMQLILAIQSIPQARRRWSTDGAQTLLDNMPAEIALGGLTDEPTLNRYATLVGDVELTRTSMNYDPASGRTTGSSEHTADRKAMRADEIRRIPDRHGLLIYRNQAAILLQMTPWFERLDGAELLREKAATERWRLAFETAGPERPTPAGPTWSR